MPTLLDDGTRKYVWGANGLAYNVRGTGTAEQVEVYHTDHLGSTRALSIGDGSLSTIYLTDEWGVPNAPEAPSGQTPSTQPFWFTGELLDQDTGTNFVYLRARHYDPGTGRFTARDSWAGSAGDPGTLNRYAYAGNNPTTWTDPDGLWPKNPDELRTCLDRGNVIETLNCIGLLPFGGSRGPATLVPFPFEDPSGLGGLGNDVVRGERTGGEGFVSLFRAVSQDELDDIVRYGGFRAGPNSYEGKLFTKTAEEAAEFGRELYRFDSKPFTIVGVKIPRSLADRLYTGTADRKSMVAVEAGELGPFNVAADIRVLPSVPLGRR